MKDLIKLLDNVSNEIDLNYNGDPSVKVHIMISIMKAKQLLEGEIYGTYKFETPEKIKHK